MKKMNLFLSILLVFSTLSSVHAEDLHRRLFLETNFALNENGVKVAFFDADSTLRVSKSGSVSANGPKDVILLPFVADRIAELNQAGYLIMIVSNQGGVGKGILPIQTADAALFYTVKLIRGKNKKARVHYIDFAENEDQFRKPGTGMAENLENELKKSGLSIDWKNSFMVGDSAYKSTDTKPDGTQGTHFSNADRLFAKNLNIAFFEPNDFFGWRCHGIDVFNDANQVKKYKKEHAERCAVIPQL